VFADYGQTVYQLLRSKWYAKKVSAFSTGMVPIILLHFFFPASLQFRVITNNLEETKVKKLI
jgi:hypothetical protein